jgi:hypothetical protein
MAGVTFLYLAISPTLPKTGSFGNNSRRLRLPFLFAFCCNHNFHISSMLKAFFQFRWFYSPCFLMVDIYILTTN